MTIRQKLIFWILGGTLFVFLTIFLFSYSTGKKTVINLNENQVMQLTAHYASRFEADFRHIAQIPTNMATFLQIHPDFTEDELLAFIRQIVAKDKYIYGSTIAFEPYQFFPELFYFAPYYYKYDSKIQYVELGNAEYRYFEWDWYLIPKLLKSPVWSEPFYDEGAGNTVMTTYSVPFYKPDSSIRGIVTADVDLQNFTAQTLDIQIGQTGYAFVISQNGTFIIHPDHNYVMRETIFSIAEASQDSLLREIGKDMIYGKTNIESIEDFWRGGKAHLAYTPIRSSQWSFAVILPEKEMMSVVTQFSKKLILFMIIGFSGLLGVVFLVSYSLTKPIKKLAWAAHELALGKLETEISGVNSKDEIGELANTFNKMVKDLNLYIHDLTETTKAKERVEHELTIASEIQQSILPHTYPPFPGRKEFDLFALTKPAREVGGDFFDFFFVDDNHIGFLVADVCGKGVPAALFMAITRTLIKTAAVGEISPAKTLENVNKAIYPDNSSCLFISIFYAIYNINDGSFCFANAGHNLPYIKYESGSVEQIPKTKSIALGVMENLQLEERNLALGINDLILLYTDGLTEAINVSEEMYEEERLVRFLKHCAVKQNMRSLTQHLLEDVEKFSGEVEQFDDITLLVLQRIQ